MNPEQTLDSTGAGRVLDHTVERTSTRLLRAEPTLKLGLFSQSVSGGSAAITQADGPPRIANFEEQRQIALAAEDAGFDALIPLSRWSGFPGPSGHWQRSWEGFTYASAIAAVTKHIHIFSTCHAYFVNPLFAAKMGSTVDHVAEGRWGLNVVAGWNPTEFSMFGIEIPDHRKRYAYAAEWLEIVERLWSESEPFDYDGEFFKLKQVETAPKPVQAPRPVVMNAGQSPSGLAFAANHADVVFLNTADKTLDAVAEDVAHVKALGRELGRDVAAWTIVQVVCRDSDQEARDFVDAYVKEGDFEAARFFAEALVGSDISTADPYREKKLDKVVHHLVESAGLPAAVGAPGRVAEKLSEYSAAGIDGLALTFVDYVRDTQRFANDVLPILRDSGLRGT
jgi:FMNH2-dependent dimethyl sulfone monooxygenase